jgi:hypothetical protein
VNGEYAGFKAPHRPDQSTVAGPGGYYGGSEVGNVVDREDINKTKDTVSKDKTSIYPGGTSSGSGY